MATTISGTGNQSWISRGAAARAFARFAGTTGALFAMLAIFELGVIAYLASIPRQIPVLIARNPDGSYASYQVPTGADDIAKKKLLADWVGSCRVGGGDAQSFADRQCRAMLLNGTNPYTSVRDFDQQVADKRETVVPVVRNITGTGNDYVVDWDESVTTPHDQPTQRAMRAYVTVGFSDQLISLGVDPLLNPYGEYIAVLRLVEIH